jgi:hypothetical protein
MQSINTSLQNDCIPKREHSVVISEKISHSTYGIFFFFFRFFLLGSSSGNWGSGNWGGGGSDGS